MVERFTFYTDRIIDLDIDAGVIKSDGIILLYLFSDIHIGIVH